uniref:hypothetical protein n=1 Tax=Marinobacterium profundum TaxID=1714300 RepID=UPI001C1FB5F4
RGPGGPGGWSGERGQGVGFPARGSVTESDSSANRGQSGTETAGRLYASLTNAAVCCTAGTSFTTGASASHARARVLAEPSTASENGRSEAIGAPAADG